MSDADSPIRVLIAAPTPALRAGLRALLTNATIAVIGEVASLAAPQGSGSERPEVVVAAEGALPGSLRASGDEAWPAVVVLAGDDRPLALLRSLPLAGWGIVAPDATAGELLAAVAAAHQGLIVLPPVLLTRLSSTRVALPPDDLVDQLTPRELEVLALLSQGQPNKLIARLLQISEHTVKFHVSSIFAKLGASSRTDAVSRAARLGLISL